MLQVLSNPIQPDPRMDPTHAQPNSGLLTELEVLSGTPGTYVI